MRSTYALLTVVSLAALALTGCFGGGGDANDDDGPAYEGEFREFDLYLTSTKTTIWTDRSADGSTRPVSVDAWLFADNEDGPFTLPGPTIRARQFDTLRININLVGNAMPHTIHWHGLHVPWDQDGVPYVSQLPFVSGSSAEDFGGPVITEAPFTYEFQVTQSGTFFYHCHVDTAHHMDMGMYGAIIVDPADPKQDPPFDREYTLQLDEWDQSHVHGEVNADTLVGGSGDPETIIDDLYSQGQDIYSNHPTLNQGKDATGIKKTRAWYPMTFPAYFPEYDTYLINGKAFPDTEMLFAEPGEVIRIRLINEGFQWHSIHLHGHEMFITHQDGRIVPALHQLGDASGLDTPDKLWDYAQPVDTVSIGPSQRFDVYVFAQNPGPWMIHDHMALGETNDHISPGGMMTMLCYESGWEPSAEFANPCETAEMSGMTSGEFLLRQTDVLAKLD